MRIADCIKLKMNEDEMFSRDTADVIPMYLHLTVPRRNASSRSAQVPCG